MNRSIGRSNAFLAVLCVALAALLVAAPAFAVHFERESLKSYEAQLHKGEVHALTFHPASGGTVGHLHISLNNGEHMSVTYASGEQAKLVAAAQAANARVKVATATAKKAPAKHKLRYIAGGILIVVILVVLIVLLVGRRRAVAGEETRQTSSGGESAA